MIIGQQSAIHLLALLFGVSAWIAINGLWQQTPLLVAKLPEAWNLASYITLITQLANIGPLIYSLLKRFTSKQSERKVERWSIHVIYLIGFIAIIFLVFFWDRISTVGGVQHSVSFLVLTFFLAIVDCTSSVLYIPFMSNVASNYLVSHLVGQSLSGLIPSFLALIQGVGGNPECVPKDPNSTSLEKLVPKYPEPRFSVSTFFILLASLTLISWICFVLLAHIANRLSESSKDLVEHTPVQSVSTSSMNEDESSIRQPITRKDNSDSLISTRILFILLLTEALICSITNGILPSIQPYSVLVYGNQAHHFVVTFASISSAIGTYLSLFVNRRRRMVLPITISLAALTTLYILLSALRSPNRLISNHSIGSVIIVLIWVFNNLCFAFSRASITRILRNQKDSRRFLFLGGVFTQIGSFVGSLLMFGIINYTKSFTSYSPC